MLQPAAAAAPKVRARRLHAVRRGTSTSSIVARPKRPRASTRRTRRRFARQAPAHEDDVAVGASDPLAAECQVLDRELERIAATGFAMGSAL